MKPKPSKPPRIKKGHKKPSFKPNADEVERRITAVELLLSRGARKHEIHTAMAKEFGIHSRTADEYTARARARLMTRLNKSKDQHRCESLAFYESMMRAADAKPGDKIRACQRKDELLGLDSPKKTVISGPDGGPIQTEDKTLEPRVPKKRLLALIGALEDTVSDGTGGTIGETRNGE
jgi:hypothetical protein